MQTKDQQKVVQSVLTKDIVSTWEMNLTALRKVEWKVHQWAMWNAMVQMKGLTTALLKVLKMVFPE